jgi:hypothetical protein
MVFKLFLDFILQIGCHITSEHPAGKGRYDVLITPPSNQYFAVIIEFKIVYDGESLVEKSQAGLQQIQDKVYRAAIPPFVNKLLELGVAFKGNSSHVVFRKLEKVNNIWNEIN